MPRVRAYPGAPAVALVAAAVLSTGPGRAEVPPSSNWLQRVERSIAAREYEVSAQASASCAPSVHGSGAVLQAPNRANNLRSCFLPDGVRIVPRTGEAAWHGGLSLRAYGAGDDRSAAGPTEPHAVGNRVEYRRGALTEWYVNDARGLEQGFTLASPLGSGATAVLVVGVPGDLVPVADSTGIGLHAAGGARALDYAKLVALDATGAELTASMRLVGGAIEIRVDTAGAHYPVMIDPLVSSPWNVESNHANAQFGSSVATAGDVNGDGYDDIVVGAPFYDSAGVNAGRAFAYLGGPGGPSMTAAWFADSGEAGAQFGAFVATAGDVNGDGYADVIVGAPSDYIGTPIVAGRAYVYLGGPSGLSTTIAWTGQSDQSNARFGFSVASAGDVNGDGFSDVIVGAYHYSNGEAFEGRSYAYHGGSGGLSTNPDWFTESNRAGASFGFAVATAGDVNADGFSDVIVGAPNYNFNGADQGRMYVFLGTATGLRTSPNTFVTASVNGALFGRSVATAGDVNGDGFADVIVGAQNYNNHGAAFIYPGTSGTTSFTPIWSVVSTQMNSCFGLAVSTAGDVNNDGYADVMVGAPCINTIFGYSGAPSNMSTTRTWQVSSNTPTGYGSAVAVAGDVNGDGYSDVLVGAPGWSNGQTGEGAAFVYLGGGDGVNVLPARFDISALGQPDMQFGASVAGAGDVNGDGFADIIIGAPRFDHGEADEGAAFIHLGSALGPTFAAEWSVESNHAHALLGWAVGGAGDVNGDGYADVIVGAPSYSASAGNEDGRALVYLGGPGGAATTPVWTLDSDQANANFGAAVGTAGDVNGDGYSDVIVGASTYSNGQDQEGRAFVYHGSPTGPSLRPSWFAEPDSEGARFGFSAGTAGDVDGDGYSDVIVGAPQLTDPETEEGEAFVYRGGPSGLATTPAWTAQIDIANALLGWSVATAGDVNGDGYSDVIVGAISGDTHGVGAGRVLVYFGSPLGLETDAGFDFDPNLSGAHYGFAVASAGDVDGDGFSDIIFGGPFQRNAGLEMGSAIVLRGSESRLHVNDVLWSDVGIQDGESFGASVAGAGDVDGDGHADFLVGSPNIDVDNTNDGRVGLYFGATRPPFPPAARQRQAGDLGPLAPLDASGSLTSVNLRAEGRSPFGRSDLAIEYELKPLGQLLDGTGLNTAPLWTDSGSASVPLAAAIGSLTPGTPYHWRLRVKYRPSTTPLQSHGPWLAPVANGSQETNFRTERDTDGDSVFDRLDDCRLVPNATQRDTNADGYGNICDGDFNDDGSVNFTDLALFRARFGTTNADSDLNGDGLVNFADLALFRSLFARAPGPSGRRP